MDIEPPQSSAPQASPRRWRMRFSLRTLVFVFPILAIFLSWIGNEVRRSQQDQAAAEAFWSRSGTLAESRGGEWYLAPFRPVDIVRERRLYAPYSGLVVSHSDYLGGLAEEDWEATGRLLGLRELTFLNYVGPDDGQTFAHLPSLKLLNLQQSRLTPNDLQQIVALPNLIAFRCDNTHVIWEPARRDDSPTATLEDEPQEVPPPDLSSGMHMAGWPAKEVQKLPALEIQPGSWPHIQDLSLCSLHLSGDSLQALSDSQTLQRLQLQTCTFEPRSLDCLASVDSLTELVIRPEWSTYEPNPPANVDEQTLTHWGRMKNLTSLSLHGVSLQNFGGASDESEDRWPQLRELTLEEIRPSTSMLQEIAAMPKLATLYISSPVADPQSTAELGRSRSLRELTFLNDGPDADALEQIAKIPSLLSLHLVGDRIDDEAMRHIAQIKWLTRLSLRDTQVTEAGFAYLERHPCLQHVQVQGGVFSYQAIASLATMPKISFGDCSFDVAGFNPLIAERLGRVQLRHGDVLDYLAENRLFPEQPPAEDAAP